MKAGYVSYADPRSRSCSPYPVGYAGNTREVIGLFAGLHWSWQPVAKVYVVRVVHAIERVNDSRRPGVIRGPSHDDTIGVENLAAAGSDSPPKKVFCVIMLS